MATQYSCLENPMDRGAWWVTVHRVTKSQPQLKHLSTQKTPRIKIVILLCNILKSQNQCKNSWWTKYQHCNIRQEQYYRYFLYLRLHYGSVWHWLECNDNKLENEVFFWRKWTSISPSLLGACWKGITVQSQWNHEFIEQDFSSACSYHNYIKQTRRHSAQNKSKEKDGAKAKQLDKDHTSE